MSLIKDVFGVSSGEKGRRKIRVNYVDGEVEEFEITNFVPVDDFVIVSLADDSREIAFSNQNVKKIEDYVGDSE